MFAFSCIPKCSAFYKFQWGFVSIPEGLPWLINLPHSVVKISNDTLYFSIHISIIFPPINLSQLMRLCNSDSLLRQLLTNFASYITTAVSAVLICSL